MISVELVLIDTGDLPENVHVPEVPVVYNACLPDHTQIFDGQGGDLSLAQFIHTGAARQDGNPQILSDKVFDGGDVIHFQYHVKALYAFPVTFQTAFKLHPGGGGGQPQDHLLPLELLQCHHDFSGQGIIVGHDAYQVIRIQHHGREAGIGHLPLHNGQIDLIGTELRKKLRVTESAGHFHRDPRKLLSE